MIEIAEFDFLSAIEFDCKGMSRFVSDFADEIAEQLYAQMMGLA